MADDVNPAAARPRRSIFERLEQGVLFLVSTLTLRALAVLAGLAAVAAVIGFLWFTVPAKEPVQPPEVAAPKLPGKPGLTSEELLKPTVQPPPAVAAEEPPAPAPASSPATPAPPQERPRSALDLELDPYRALAERLGLPFETERQVVCLYRGYRGKCLATEERQGRKGLLDMIRVDVFLDGAPEEVQIALLRQARKLFDAIESPPPATSTFDALSGPEGFKVLVSSFLQPALDVLQGYRKIQRATDSAVPASDRLRLVEDVYPTLTAAVAGLRDREPAERRAAVGRALALLIRKETQRSRDSITALREHARAVDAREEKIAADRAAYQDAQERSATRRTQALWVVLAGIGGLTSLGILLALLAIERHLRWLREAGRVAEVPGVLPPPTAAEVPATAPEDATPV